MWKQFLGVCFKGQVNGYPVKEPYEDEAKSFCEITFKGQIDASWTEKNCPLLNSSFTNGNTFNCQF